MMYIYLKHSKEVEIWIVYVIRLVRLQYGLADSGDNSNDTCSGHIREDVDMMATAGDISFFLKTVHGN